MFKQIKDLAGGEYYLIASLLVFLAFFVLIAFYLLKINKEHIQMMSELPIDHQQVQNHEED